MEGYSSMVEAITPKHQKQKTAIISAKRKKKYYDQQGKAINTDDKEIIQDIASGKTVISYGEGKVGGK
jgi:hypothetical protein